jgi:membrane protein DedA with SNARE-associated domain
MFSVSLEKLVSHYGYFAIIIGTFLEGETILVLGGFLAHRGYLHLPWVIASAFAGTFAGDQLFFFLGRFKGTRWLEKRPEWKRRSTRAFQLLRKHQLLVILGFRFIYGVRTITPFVIGASGISPIRFIALNGGGAAVWALGIGILGFLLGETLQLLLGEVKRFELIVLAALVAIGLIIWLTYLWRERKEVAADEPADSAE